MAHDQELGPNKGRSPLAAIAGATFVWLFLSALIFFPIWTLVPRTRLPWIVLIVFGPPFYAVGDVLAGRLARRSIGESGRATRRSVPRVAIGLLVMAIGVLITLWIARQLGVDV
jgi:hypothetical protein